MKKVLSLLVSLLLVFALAGYGLAEPELGWDPTDKEQIFITLQSRIMEIDHAQNSLVVAERKIELFKERDGGRDLTTMLRDAHGGAIAWETLQRGDLVFIRGFEQSGAPALAREIHLLPAESRRQTFPFLHNITDWSWAPVKAEGKR